MSSARLARLALLVTVLAWSSSFAAMRIAVQSFAPAHVALLRYLVAALALAVVARRAGVRLPPPRDLARIAVIGAIGLGAYNVALAAGQRTLPAGTASLLIASAPIWMAVFAATFGRERLGRAAIAGLAIGFVGVAVIESGAIGGGWAVLIELFAALLQAAYSMTQRPLVARHGALAFMTIAAASAALALVPAAGGIGAELAAAPPSALAAIVFLGLVPGAIGYGTWAYASTRVSTAAAGAALYLVPPVAIAIAFVVLGERPGIAAAVGGALVLGGVVLARRGA